MAAPKPVTVDQRELDKAQKLWENFGVATKWSIILIGLALVGLAALTL